MKLTVLALALTFPMIASAANTDRCPSGTKTLYKCQSAPQAGDNEMVAEIFESIKVCKGSNGTYLIGTKWNESSTAMATELQRAGGNSYTMGNEVATFTLSITTGIRSRTLPATLEVSESRYLEGSSSYTCK